MSGASGSGAPPPAGVVCNSALSFVASAQALPENNAQGNLQDSNNEQMAQADRIVPIGLKSLCEACSKLYPDQPNPLQVTTRLKYWLGGEDPLDYISMYWNPGRPEDHIPPHWHYISFGISDLHGDGRVHPLSLPDSGYGFELTFRLYSEESVPPLWPAALCQALARYVFTTGNKFCAGDHISWHRPLDGSERGRVKHLLVDRDPTLGSVHTPHGNVDFLQIVGCTSRELKAAQRGSGFEVLGMMKEDPECGGPQLVTRASRVQSARGVGSPLAPLPSAPATLAGVSCLIRWIPIQKSSPASSPSKLSTCIEQQIKETLQRGLTAMSHSSTQGVGVGHMSTDSFEMSSIEKALPQITDTRSSWRDEDSVQAFDAVHIFMNVEGASLIPLALQCRIDHGRHFTWRSESAVTFVSRAVVHAFVTGTTVCAARDSWLQVLITEEISESLLKQYCKLDLPACDSDTETDAATTALPLTISAKYVSITITH